MAMHQTPPPPSRQEIDKGLNDLAGHLLWQAEVEAARSAAERLADDLPWLTTPQREDLVRVCAADRLASSRAMLQRTADRAVTLRAEYETRYAALRRGLLACTVTPLLVLYGLAALLLLTR